MTSPAKTKSAFYTHCHRCQECESFYGEQTWGRCRLSGVTVKGTTKGRRCHSKAKKLTITAPGYPSTLGWNGEKMTFDESTWKTYTADEARAEREKIHAHPFYCAMNLRIS